MKYKYILYEPGKVARIKLNRPQYKNAISYKVFEELDDAFTGADTDEGVQVIVLSGEGTDFSSGHDLGTPEARADRDPEVQDDIAQNWFSDKWWQGEKLHKLDFRLRHRNLKKPTIAMVQGWCIFGATQLASACDIIFAADDAKFVPLFSQYFYPPWELGPRKAKEVLFEHRAVSALEARELGWVNRVYPLAILERETLAYANRVADNSPWNVRAVKAAVNHMVDTMGFTNELQYAYNQSFIPGGITYNSQWAVGAGFMGATSRDRRVGRPDVALQNLKLKEAAEVK